jgi:hypothetical protein
MSANNKGILGKVFSDMFSLPTKRNNDYDYYHGKGGKPESEDKKNADPKEEGAKGENAAVAEEGAKGENAAAEGDSKEGNAAVAEGESKEGNAVVAEGDSKEGNEDGVEELADCEAIKSDCEAAIECDEGDKDCEKEGKKKCKEEAKACKEDNEKTIPQESTFSKLFSSKSNSNSNAAIDDEPRATGPIAPLRNAGSLYKRVFIIAFIFCLAVFLASVTFRSKHMIKKALKLHGEKENPDPNFDADDAPNIERWRRAMQFIGLFVILTITYFIAIVIAILVIIAVFIGLTNKDKDLEIWKMAASKLSNLIWQFEINGETHVLLYMYGIIIAILLISMILFMVYFIFVKDYLTNLYYPMYVDMNKKNPKPEFTNTTKFACFYGLYVIIIFMFFMLLFSIYHLSNESLLINCIIYIVIVIMLMMLIYRYTLERSAFRVLIIWIVSFLFLVIYYFIFDGSVGKMLSKMM